MAEDNGNGAELAPTPGDGAVTDTASDRAVRLEGGTYEVIRNRLTQHSGDLRTRLGDLNEARREVFGAVETTLVATERITTEHNCTPRDMITIGDRLLFGYNVHFGLKTDTRPADVFAVYRYENRTFFPEPMDLIDDERFVEDFKDIYRYYKKTIFAKFTVIGPHLYMVFRIGDATDDIKAFKWLLDGDRLRYVDNRSDHEVRFPSQHEFEWVRTHRDLHRHGAHPHISIDDRVFVETVGGDLTVKVEDNTDSGEGIYAEPVADIDQTLDDAEVFYAVVGHIILLKIRPYQENEFRYLVFNEKAKQVVRLDSIENSCVLLPDEHGLIFSDGYYLQTGELQVYGTDLLDMKFERRIPSPNGEDFLYVFYNRRLGDYVLLSYNLISQNVSTPILCNGFCFYGNGELLYFKTHEDPQKHHVVQIWQTPYAAEELELPAEGDSFLAKIGNRDIVRGMAECHEVLTLLDKDDEYGDLYLDIVKKTEDVLKSYFWIDRDEVFQLSEPLSSIREAASAAVGEFDKVVQARRETRRALRDVEARTEALLSDIKRRRFESIADYVECLSELRVLRGETISLRERRYVDTGAVDALEESIEEANTATAERCVEFLLAPDALDPYRETLDGYRGATDGLAKVVEARELEERVDRSAGELELLIDMVGNLKIADASQRTEIIDRISELFTHVNQVRAGIRGRIKRLAASEGIAELGSQLKLLDQSVINYLDVCDTPEKCDEFLTKLMVQLEELEGRFAEFDDYLEELATKRQEIYDAFEARKLALIEARNRRAESLRKTADRLLSGIQVRVEKLESVVEINTYFASDLMIDKVRDIVAQLLDIDDSVKADEVQSRLKALRDSSVRQLKDRQELYVDGRNVIRFGQHRFSVNVQPLDLTLVPRDGRMCFHLTGTDFFEPVDDAEFQATAEVWGQELVSETDRVYRAEYLAYRLYRELRDGTLEEHRKALTGNDEKRLSAVRELMAPRFHEGYVKGVHDHDASRILAALLELDDHIGLLRHHPRARALAGFLWHAAAHSDCIQDGARESIVARIRGFAEVERLFPRSKLRRRYVDDIRALLGRLLEETPLFDARWLTPAAEYLFEEVLHDGGIVIGKEAVQLRDAFQAHLKAKRTLKKLQQSLGTLSDDVRARFQLLRDWVTGFAAQLGDEDVNTAEHIDEVALLLLLGDDRVELVHSGVATEIDGLLGEHANIDHGKLHLDFNELTERLRRHDDEIVPRYERYQRLKKELLEQEKNELRLDEFKPRVLTSFVRNRLIDEVYLPRIGNNLAKQIGVAGEEKRTDLMGLLLLISPPGYGKTTLMEYIAHRLGITFVKVNGPAIGHRVTSLDPDEAPNSAAREEVEKLNLALEMGDNVMIYLDDIQHLNPELLQKFISLCDAQRRIEGVFKGRARTYDLRGRKVAVVMAGNPYTESGEQFQVPDMLANRADTYNLGDIIGDASESFELSYIENALTSNSVLSRLANRSHDDVHALLRVAAGRDGDGVDLEGNYSAEEVEETVSVLRKLMRLRDVVLAVNTEYIRSAAQEDDYRTEPPFLLQGSYRNMNKLAEQVVPVMNDAEVETLIRTHYESEAQTLTTGAESNLLKLKELLGTQNDEEQARWTDIKKSFARNVKLRGLGDDQHMGQILAQMGEFSDGLASLKETIAGGLGSLAAAGAGKADRGGGLDESSREVIRGLIDELRRSETPPAEVNVVNKVPLSVLNVVKQQFKVMESWMAPLMDVMKERDASLESLRKDLEKTRKNYEKLIQRMEDGDVESG